MAPNTLHTSHPQRLIAQMNQPTKTTTLLIALLVVGIGHNAADDPMPAGLPSAIQNPGIPSILDVTILNYNDAGHGEISVNKVHKAGRATAGHEWAPPKVIRGYGTPGSDKIAALNIVAGTQHKRFLVFLDGDLLYSTYNHRFPIRKTTQGQLEVGIGFNGSGGPWLALSDILKRIPKSKTLIRNYTRSAELTEAEEQSVIQLAKRCGINNIAKISTYFLRPSSDRGITVESVEEIDGRNVSCKALRVVYNKWSPQNDGPRDTDTQLGDFWAGKSQNRQQIILKVDDTEYRTSSVTGLTIKQCETILAAFLKGNYKPAGGTRSDLDNVDWTRPQGFYKRRDVTSVSFPHKQKGSGFFELELQGIKPPLTVNQVMQAVP